MPLVVVLVGISGVGKSWMLSRAMKSLPGQVLSASALIAHELGRIDPSGDIKQDRLRELDITANQTLLSRGVKRAIDPAAERVVLDAHTLIDTPHGLTSIATEVFERINPDMFVFVAGAPEDILAHRSRDDSRKRPQRTLEELAEQQSAAQLRTEEIATQLRIPLNTIEAGDVAALRHVLCGGKGAL